GNPSFSVWIWMFLPKACRGNSSVKAMTRSFTGSKKSNAILFFGFGGRFFLGSLFIQEGLGLFQAHFCGIHLLGELHLELALDQVVPSPTGFFDPDLLFGPLLHHPFGLLLLLVLDQFGYIGFGK